MVVDGPSHHDSNNGALGWIGNRLGMGALLGFFSTKVLRGGPKILLYLASFLVLLLFVIRFLPERYTESPFGSGTQPFWKWDGSKSDGATEQKDTTGGGRVGGNGTTRGNSTSGPLRIVVFGENDIATPSPIEGMPDKKHRAWTEVLCEEVCRNRWARGRGHYQRCHSPPPPQTLLTLSPV